MTWPVWWMEWRQALRRPRVMVLSIVVPLGLVASVTLGHAPAPHAALVITVLFTFFGTFGAGIPWARDAERGLIHRVLLTGIGAPAATLQRWASSALIDVLQLLPSLCLIIVAHGAGARQSVTLLASVALGVAAANALGIVVAGIARSLAETALLASVAALLLLHGAGVFRTPPAGSVGARIQPAIPFYYMSVAVRSAVGAR